MENCNDYLASHHFTPVAKSDRLLGLSVTAGAKFLGVTRQALNNLVNERAGISPEMAIRLDKAFGGAAEGWLALQVAYDLAQARKNPLAVKVKRYAPKPGNERRRLPEKTAEVHAGLEALIARESARRLAIRGGSEPKLKAVPRRRSRAVR